MAWEQEKSQKVTHAFHVLQHKNSYRYHQHSNETSSIQSLTKHLNMQYYLKDNEFALSLRILGVMGFQHKWKS
jgi:hypothetical protein